jgi:RNA polymerase sigma factor (sigma-70 family)
MVLGLCRLLLRDAVEAEDAAQQVFLSAHQAMVRGSPPRDPAAWVAAIARNECRARIRARMREPLALPELPSDLPDPLASAIRAADLEAIWSALGKLPRRQRRALVMRELGGLSYHELGRALGVSHSAVESLVFRARQRLRSLVLGVSTAAVPAAVRDELARLLPGFEAAPPGVAARVAALPIAWKLAGAAVGVGVVATGAGGLQTREARVAQHAHRSITHVQREARVQPQPATVPQFAPTARPVKRLEREVEAEPAEHAGPVEQGEREPDETGSDGPGPAPAQTLEVAQSHEGPGGGGEVAVGSGLEGSGSGHSGPDGSGSGGSGESSGADESGHSGPG